MAEKTRTELKEYFNAGDRPTETQFADLIDSFLNRVEDPFIDTIPEASTSQKGIVQQASETEVNEGTNDDKYVTPKGVKDSVTTLAPVTSVNGQTGEVNITIPTVDDSGWQTPTLLYGFTNYGSGYQGVHYRKINKVVHIEGLVKGGHAGREIFILPAGFRPSTKLVFAMVYDRAKISYVEVDSNGLIVPDAIGGTWTNITGISFPVD